MMELEGIISKSQFSDSELVEARDIAFDVDSQQMLRKTKQYLLVNKYDYVKELLRASINSKPSKIKMSTRGGDFSIRHDGEGLTREDLDLLLSNIFVSQNDPRGLGRYMGITRGVLSALQTDGVVEVIVDAAKNGNGVRYRISPDVNITQEKRFYT